MDIDFRSVILYTPNWIKPDKQTGEKIPHMHTIIHPFMSPAGKKYYQLLATSQAIEEYTDKDGNLLNTNVVKILIGESNLFTKETRFNCDRLQEGAITNVNKDYGKISEEIFQILKNAIKNSKNIKPYKKKRMGLIN